MPELFQCFDGKELGAVARRMTQGFQQAGGDKDGNLMRLEAKEPGGLRGVEPGRSKFPTQELCLLFCDTHSNANLPFGERRRVYGVHKNGSIAEFVGKKRGTKPQDFDAGGASKGSELAPCSF
jgi:hypothetical protein